MKFVSMLSQNENKLDANQLYTDISKHIENLEKDLPEDKRISRKHPLKHILNSTSGGYVSPTAMKSFELCPASYLFAKLVPDRRGSATSVGTTFHTIMQKLHDLEPEKRSRDSLEEIIRKTIIEDNQQESEETIREYVRGYLTCPDYNSDSLKPMDIKNLTCFNEVFIKPVINPLGVNLGVPIYLLIDRIDIRDNGISVVDYKTGFGDPNPYLLGENGYLPQMIFYKWGVEAEYGQDINKAFLCLPGADSIECKYTEMNVHSLVEQSKVVEQVKAHLDRIRETREKKIFESTTMRYCNSCPMKEYCYTYIRSRSLNLPIPKEIPVSIEFNEEEFIEDKKEE